MVHNSYSFFPFFPPFVFTDYLSHVSLSENRDKFTKYDKKLYKLPATAVRTSVLECFHSLTLKLNLLTNKG